MTICFGGTALVTSPLAVPGLVGERKTGAVTGTGGVLCVERGPGSDVDAWEGDGTSCRDGTHGGGQEETVFLFALDTP